MRWEDDQMGDVQEFHDLVGQRGPTSEGAAVPLRVKLVQEEAREFAAACGYVAPEWVRTESPVDIVELADAAADIAYVALGSLLHMFGPACARAIWDEVHRSNMAKFPGGVVTLSSAGKVVKPEGWQPPDISGVLIDHGILPDVLA